MEFSKRLKGLREKSGLSQESLANALGIPRTSIAHYENSDDRIPRQKRLNQIADFFGVSVDYLIGRSESEDYTNTEKEFLEDAQEMSIEELSKKFNITVDGKLATKEEIKAAIAFIRSLRDLN